MTTLHDLLTRAVGLHQAGETDRAITLYRSILAVDPAQADALHLLGLLDRHTAPLHGAMLVARALRLVPVHSGALFNQANSLVQMGRLDAAMAHFRRKLEVEPDCVMTLSHLGRDALARGRIDEAERLLRRAAALETGDHAAERLRHALQRCVTARTIRDDAADPSLPPGLVVRGVFRDSSGYAYVVRRFVQELVAAGIRVRLVDLNYGGADNLPDSQIDPLLLSLDRPVRAKAVVTVTTPPAVESVPGLKTINFSMFEAVDIPPLWAGHSRRHDHVVVATESSRTAWLRAGHPQDRIHICPAGVETNAASGDVSPAVIADNLGRRLADYPVRILNVSDFNDRKNLDGILRVWLRTTRKEEPAALLLKPGKAAGVSGGIRALLAKVSAQTGRTPDQAAPVFLVEGKLSDTEMTSLHAASTHYWSMSHGEGWDLPMAQAGAMGLTLLAPDHSAYHAYLDAEVAHMIPSAVTPGIGAYASQSWWSPDEGEAARLLRAVIDDPAGTRRSAQAHLLEHFSWQAATRRLIALLRELDAL
ncbi:tetratricopeptide repeat protein [Azospirillum palustre]